MTDAMTEPRPRLTNTIGSVQQIRVVMDDAIVNTPAIRSFTKSLLGLSGQRYRTADRWFISSSVPRRRVQSGTASAARPRYHQIMTLSETTIATVVALAIICTVVAVTLVNFTGNWLLAVAWGVLPLLILLRMWHPRLRPAYARAPRR